MVQARSLVPLLRGEVKSLYAQVYGYFGGVQHDPHGPVGS